MCYKITGAMLVIMLVVAGSQAQDKYLVPGPQHELLKKFVGDWDCAGKIYMGPDQPALELKGTATMKLIMDGRFLKEKFDGDMMGQSFQGLSILGHDNVRNEYVGVWISNHEDRVETSTGSYDENTHTLTMTGKSYDPKTGEDLDGKILTKFVDDDTLESTMYVTCPETGQEIKVAEFTYERKGACIIEKLLGEWECVGQVWVPGQSEAFVFAGTSKVTVEMDGRFAKEYVKGTMHGRPFDGVSIIGYDKKARKYTSVFFSNMATKISQSAGTYDEQTKTLTMTGKDIDYKTGKEYEGRIQVKFAGPDRLESSMHLVIDGREIRLSEFIYTRTK